MKKRLAVFILSSFFTANSFAQVSLLKCHNKGWLNDMTEIFSDLYSINDSVQEYMACGNGANIFISQIVVAVIDFDSCAPWGTPGINPLTQQFENQNNYFGQLNANGSCGRSRSEKLYYWNQTSQTSMNSLSTFLGDIVPDSSCLLIYTWIIAPNNVNGYPCPGAFSNWQPDVLSTLQNLGFTGLDTINLSYPWIFFVKKGDFSTVQTVVGTHPEDTLDFATLICTNEPFISSNSVTICEGDSATISGNSELLNYSWSTGELTPTITVSDSGYYTLTGQLDSVYSYVDSTFHPVLYTDSIFIDVISCTGIEELENSFSVFPNPAKENINISLKKSISKPSKLSIFNMYGVLKERVEIPPNKNNLEIPISGFSSGVYFFSIETENGSSPSQKVIVF